MDYKPSDVFVGVIDFFAVLLPGAIIVALGYSYLPEFIRGADGIVPALTGSARWAGIIIASYAAGHILFFIGSGLDSMLYDPWRRWKYPPAKDKPFVKALQIQKSSIPFVSTEIVNTYQWCRARLRLGAPEALMEVERYEADSKFFRGLSVAAYVLVLVFVGETDPNIACLKGVEAACLRLAPIPLALALPILLLAAVPGRDRHDKKYEECDPKPPHEPQEGRLRLAFFLLSASIGLLLIITANWKALVLFGLLYVCLARYAERRWKSTKTAYQYVAILNQVEVEKAARVAMTVAGEIVEQAGAIAFRGRGRRREVLLVRERNGSREWLFPKGHVEPNETPEIAAVRELREETGVWGLPVADAGAVEFNLAGRRHRVHYYVIETQFEREPLEKREYEWFALDEVSSALTFPDVRELFIKALPLLTPGFRSLAPSSGRRR